MSAAPAISRMAPATRPSEISRTAMPRNPTRSISMPAIVGSSGVEEVLNLPLSPSELIAFQNSAQTLKDWLDELGD